MSEERRIDGLNVTEWSPISQEETEKDDEEVKR